MFRSVAAVFAGFVILNTVVWLGSGVLALIFHASAAGAVPPQGYLPASLLVTALGAALAGIVAAHVATTRKLVHAAALAGLMLLMAIVTISTPAPSHTDMPRWYLPALAVVGPLMALAGGGWRATRPSGGRPES